MRRLFFILLLLVSPALDAVAAGANEPANAVMVIVNDSVITQKDVIYYVGPTVDLLRRQYGARPSMLEQKVLEAQREGVDQLVERRLILDEYKRAGYNIPDSVIDDRVRERIKRSYGDRLSLTRTLEAEGITYETFRNRIKEDFIIGIMRNHNISQDIIISPFKIEKYYTDNLSKFKVGDSVKLRMIVVNQPATAPAGMAKKLAQEILSKLGEGASFADMATVYSEGSQKAQGGDWGWVEKTVLRKELADVAFTLKPGQRSDIIETKDACYVMLVEDVRANYTKTLPEVRDEIEKALISQERARLSKQWIERLKAKSFVRYF
jgi:parvulin-like peptidyl-prolyl isomerase